MSLANKSFVSNLTIGMGATDATNSKSVFSETLNKQRYESAKRRLPFETDNMFQHSVKARITAEHSPVSVSKVSNGDESPIKVTLKKMQSSENYPHLNFKSERSGSQISLDLKKVKSINSVTPKRFSMDVNSLLFNHSSTQIIDENVKLDERFKNKLKEEQKL